MKRKKTSNAEDDEAVLKKSRTLRFDDGWPRMTAVGCTSFPEDVSRIVADYLSGSEREYVVAMLVGVHPVALFLSPDVDLQTNDALDLVPSELVTRSWPIIKSKQFPITDVERCLSFLEQTNPNKCRIVVEVLVLNFSLPGRRSPRALDDLRNTLGALQGHLDNMKHVVVSITEDSSCYFALKSPLDNATGFAPPVDQEQVLLQIIDDLETCWNADGMLSEQGLFAFYFTSGVQRASEKYLAKLFISLSEPLNRVLFKEEASQMHSNKIVWKYNMFSFEDSDYIEPDAIGFCHELWFSMSNVKPIHTKKVFSDYLTPALLHPNSSFIEKLRMHFGDYPFNVKLPQLNAPLRSTTPFSALVDLSLLGAKITLHLTQLNNGFFPHLAHLDFRGARITGHLDSDRVPSLKTLNLRYYSRTNSKKPEDIAYGCAQSLIHAGRPWQLVATKEPGGWSLASYDPPALNALNDEKEDPLHSPHSPQLIRELLLVAEKESNSDEWQAQLRGEPSLEAAAGDHSDHLLVWAPQCVQKITAISLDGFSVRLKFKEPIHEQTPILTSFTCYGGNVALDGAALPLLLSLELNDGYVKLSGAFSNLKTLVFQEADLKSKWEVNAPLLQSLNCRDMFSGHHISLDLQLLPRLSCLQIKPFEDAWSRSPLLFGGKHTQALSSVHQSWLGGGRVNRDLFKACLESSVRHLELTVSALGLPVTWYTAMLLCETLTINVIEALPQRLQQQKPQNLVVLPHLTQVKTLRVTSQGCPVVLNSQMPKLAECTVPTPKWLGPNFKCPALQRIHFTGDLSEGEKKKCLDPATYVAFGARPRWVYFDDGEIKRMSWDVAPSASREPSLAGPLEDGDGSFVPHE